MRLLRILGIVVLAVLLMAGYGYAKEAVIESWSSEDAEGGKVFSVVVKNNAPAQGFLLSTRVVNSGEEFSNLQIIESIGQGEEKEIKISNVWEPEAAGSYFVEFRLLAENGEKVYDELSDGVIVEKEESYEVYVQCGGGVEAGEVFGAKTAIVNTGNAFDDIQLEWYLVDGNGSREKAGSMPVAVRKGEARSFDTKAAIAGDAKAGVYRLEAEAVYGEERKGAECGFVVGNYDSKVELMSLEIERLKKEISESLAKNSSMPAAFVPLGSAAGYGLVAIVVIIAGIALYYWRKKRASL